LMQANALQTPAPEYVKPHGGYDVSMGATV